MAKKYIQEKNFLYEVNEKDEKTSVRSTDSSTRAYLRFTNKTSRPVDVIWRDFRGVSHQYLCLGPGGFTDINSYVSHPWEFVDPATKENFVINNCIIFRAPPKLGGMNFRTNWNITVQVRSLRFIAMLSVAERMRDVDCVQRLGLPHTLQRELEKLVECLSR